jgi:galactose-1-phosphate uridylyltransferase
VLPIIPEAVQSDMDGDTEYYAMNYDNLVPVLVKAMQEQQSIIETQEQRIAYLENK